MSDVNSTPDLPDDDASVEETSETTTETSNTTTGSATDSASGPADSASTDTLGARGADGDNAASKDPADWVTGDEPMTAAQQSYLDTLAREAGEELPDTLTKAEASIQIDRLQDKTGRG